MYAKKRPLWRVLLLIAAVALICALIGSAVGKYIYTETLSASVTFSAEMAESMVLQESTAQRQADGHYELSAAPTDSNTYELIPGLDVPKDPHIVITGKTPVKAYLFVEVVNNLSNPSVTYSIASGWTQLDVAGKHGGTVYVYNTVLDETQSDYTVYILDGNTVTVSDQLLLDDTAAADVLKFYAYLGEATDGATKEDVYKRFITAP